MIESVEYRDIEGFPGYRIGNDGSVWSEWKRNGRQAFRSAGDWHQMARPCNQYGYPKVQMTRGGVKHQRAVATLVLEAFVGPRPAGYVCCHFPDPTPSNCALSNLRWDTRKANEDDKRKHGNLLVGDARWNTKLPDASVAEIRAVGAAVRVGTLARKYGVCHSTISQILSGKRRTAVLTQ